VTINLSAFTFVSDMVKQDAAIVVGPGKEYLVESRLLPIARAEGFGDVGALIARLQMTPDERLRRQVVEAMTTNETSFFRDRDPFALLNQLVFPELCRRRSATHRINVWSAACSSGQEPYSIAMSALDHPLITSDWQVQVLATDISEDILARADQGRYSQLEVNRGLPAAMLVRHFERAETEWKVVPAVRSMVKFKRLNLGDPFDLPMMDVVFLRNVLIYFDAGTKTDVLQRVRRVLKPDGFLFLGGSETTIGLDDGFERVAIGNATVYRPRGADPLETPLPENLGVAGRAAAAGRVSFPSPQGSQSPQSPFGGIPAGSRTTAPAPATPAANAGGAWPWLSQVPLPPRPGSAR
jgi:chemotaxis protein methyltransferase CheR